LIQIKVPLNRKLSLSDTARWLIAVKTAVHEWATKEPWVVVYDTILRPWLGLGQSPVGRLGGPLPLESQLPAIAQP
jgi:hypothetical protein